MTPTAPIRPVLLVLLATSLSGCGMVESDPRRFENLANHVAAIPLDGARAMPVRDALQSGLRGSVDIAPPADAQPLRVEVMDPHDLWDARDAGLRGAIEQAAPRMIQAAAPAIADAMVQQVSHQVSERITGATATVRADVRTAPRKIAPSSATLVQLGAFSSEASARAAWTRLRGGSAGSHLSGLTPVYEAVRRNGVTLTRLKAPVPDAGAAAVCAAARIDAPWCHRSA